jgi:hypothetical protein
MIASLLSQQKNLCQIFNENEHILLVYIFCCHFQWEGVGVVGGGQVSLFTLPAHRKAKLVLSGKPNHSTLHLFYHWFYSPVKTVLLICRIETESFSIAKCLTNKSLHFKRYRKGVSNCDKLVLTKCVKMSLFEQMHASLKKSANKTVKYLCKTHHGNETNAEYTVDKV